MTNIMNHAKIRFNDESRDKFRIYPVSYIKYSLNDKCSIQPKTPTDFESRHTYYSNWPCEEDDCFDNHENHFYPCLILALGESLEDVENQNLKRTKIPKIPSDLGSLKKKKCNPNKLENEKKQKLSNYRSQVAIRSQDILNKCSNNEKQNFFNDSSNSDVSSTDDEDDSIKDKLEKTKKSVLNDLTNKPKIISCEKLLNKIPIVSLIKPSKVNSKNKNNSNSNKNCDSAVEDLTLMKKTLSNDGNLSDDISDDQRSSPIQTEEYTTDIHSPKKQSLSNDYNQNNMKKPFIESSPVSFVKTVKWTAENEDNEPDENKSTEESNFGKRRLSFESQDKASPTKETELKNKLKPTSSFRVQNSPQRSNNNSATNKTINNQNLKTKKIVRRRRTLSKQDYILQCLQHYESGDGIEEKEKRYEINCEREVYLGEGIWVSERRWNLIQLNPPLTFLRILSTILWDEYDLANRALDLKKVRNQIPNRSPVKLIEPNGLRLIISLFDDFLNRNKRQYPAKEEFLLKVTTTLKYVIRNLRQDCIDEADPERRVKRRSGPVLRYNATD